MYSVYTARYLKYCHLQCIHSSVLALLTCTVYTQLVTYLTAMYSVYTARHLPYCHVQCVHSSVLAVLSCPVYTQLGTCRTATYNIYTARYLPYCHVSVYTARYLPYCHVQCIHSSVLAVLPCTVYTQLGTCLTATYSIYTARYLPYCHVQYIHSSVLTVLPHTQMVSVHFKTARVNYHSLNFSLKFRVQKNKVSIFKGGLVSLALFLHGFRDPDSLQLSIFC